MHLAKILKADVKRLTPATVVVQAQLEFPTGGWTAEARWRREAEILVVEIVARGPPPGHMTTMVIYRPKLNFDVAAGLDVYSIQVVGANGSEVFTL